LLETIEQYGMGLAIVVDDNGKLAGLITNADIRRALIKYFDKISEINPSTIINRKPVITYDTYTVEEIIRTIKKQAFPIQFLPVINKKDEVVGLLRFNNLIKGEL
jgi:CBS domain-containing protein